MADRDDSVYFVQVDSEAKGQPRAVRAPKGLRPGDPVEVEFGAVWEVRHGRNVRVAGTWRRCVVIAPPPHLVNGSGQVHVTLAPALVTTQLTCRCEQGWVCEEHEDRPWPHDDCLGPGMRCPDPRCPWWQGPKPAALDSSDWDDAMRRDGTKGQRPPS